MMMATLPLMTIAAEVGAGLRFQGMPTSWSRSFPGEPDCLASTFACLRRPAFAQGGVARRRQR